MPLNKSYLCLIPYDSIQLENCSNPIYFALLPLIIGLSDLTLSSNTLTYDYTLLNANPYLSIIDYRLLEPYITFIEIYITYLREAGLSNEECLIHKYKFDEYICRLTYLIKTTKYSKESFLTNNEILFQN